MLKKYFHFNTWIILSVIILIELAFNLVLQKYAMNENVLYNSLAQDLSVEEINNVAKITHSYSWGTFLWVPFSILIQVFLIAACINVGTLLLRYNIRFKEIFSVVVKAFAVFAIARLILIGAYTYFGVNDFSDLDFLAKLSVYEWVNKVSIPDWAVFPLQKVNLFQIIFILLLAVGLNLAQHRGLKRWIPVVLGTYGVGLAIVMVLVVFLAFL